MTDAIRVAYADPPYLGCGQLYVAHHPNALDWNDPETHRRLIEQMNAEFPNGWAMSASEPSLRTILPMCPEDVRMSAWVKPFAVFKPNVGVAYAWEPVIWRGGRPRTRQQDTVRNWLAENITLKRGLTGAKPRKFCRWVFEQLNLQSGDDLVDLFPGTGAVTAAWSDWCGEIAPSFEMTFELGPKIGAKLFSEMVATTPADSYRYEPLPDIDTSLHTDELIEELQRPALHVRDEP